MGLSQGGDTGEVPVFGVTAKKNWNIQKEKGWNKPGRLQRKKGGTVCWELI